VLQDGVPCVWFDRASHHLVVFDRARRHADWASSLAGLVATGRERSIEVRKVDGGPVPDEIATMLREVGFVDGYRGLVRRG
jgi:hypothetical protein